MDMQEALIYIAAVALALFIYGLRPLQRWRLRNFKGPRHPWLMGNASSLMGMGAVFSYQKWNEEFREDPYRLLLGAIPAIAMPNVEDARAALLHAPARPNMTANSVIPRRPGHDPTESLLWATGDKWKSLRNAWQPVFYSSSLKGYMEIMDAAADLLVTEMNEAADSSEKYFDIQPMIQAMTMNVIGQSAFGVELRTQKADTAWQSPSDKERSQRLLTAAHHVLQPGATSKMALLGRLFPFMIPLLKLVVRAWPEKAITDFIDTRATLRDVVDELLADHQATLVANEASLHSLQPHKKDEPKQLLGDPSRLAVSQNGQGNGALHQNGQSSSVEGSGTRKGVKPGSFIDLLVRGSMKGTGENFTTNQKAQQVMLMLIAGYETSANTLVFTIYLLARSCNIEKLAKLVEEIDSLGRDYTPGYEDLEERLPYLDAVVKESLRLFPPGHLLLREATEDMNVRGHQLKKGQMITISAFALHRDKKTWGQDADTFLPERWLTPGVEEGKKMRQNFLAFGNGPRVCPGQRFALLEIKVTLIRILQQFTISLAPHQVSSRPSPDVKAPMDQQALVPTSDEVDIVNL